MHLSFVSIIEVPKDKFTRAFHNKQEMSLKKKKTDGAILKCISLKWYKQMPTGSDYRKQRL